MTPITKLDYDQQMEKPFHNKKKLSIKKSRIKLFDTVNKKSPKAIVIPPIKMANLGPK